jgi:serine/threonine protein kinase/tetratricopeptide (TPR) repeat protein
VSPDAGADVFQAATAYQGFQLRSAEDVDEWWKSLERAPKHTNLFLELHRSDPEAAHRLAQAVTTMPAAGADFLGFRLLGELGRGAFARVYLARQGDLADRCVVLKVSPDIGDESRTLAQLQHTNVVPIYSLHRAGSLQAVCMPYLGATTLSGVLKGIQGRESLPESGKGLVSTLVDRKSTTVPHAPAPPEIADCGLRSADFVGVLNPQSAIRNLQSATGSTMILEMLERLSYVEAVLWIGTRLADGLAHAHERGILHRDLKPDKILLTDEGQPMLLDFNLAYDTKLRLNASAALVGGTLPYMSPEQLVAYRAGTATPNPNSDLYALGVIFYELLTGRHPFPAHCGPTHEILAKMIDDRHQPPPSVRRWNKAVSPAVESIVRHCLEPNPAKRYQSARELQEDLERQLDHLPLKYAPEPSLPERARKWVRRHPRLTSSTSIAVLAAAVVVGLAAAFVVRGTRLARLEAQTALGQLLKDKEAVQHLLTDRTGDAAQLEQGIEQCRQALAPYQALDNPAWQELPQVRNLPPEDRQRLRESVGELFILLAKATALQAEGLSRGAERDEKLSFALRLNGLAEPCFDEGKSRAVWLQRAELTRRLGNEDEAKELAAKAERIPLLSPTDYFLVSAKYVSEGRYKQARQLLEEATQNYPQSYWSWFFLGVCHDGQLRYADSAACYTTCIALWPQFPWAYYNRGLAHVRQQRYRQAIHDLTEAVALRPNFPEAFVQRALAKQGTRDYPGAIKDLDGALELGAPATQVYLIRAGVRQRLGDKDGAERDRKAGLESVPHDELGWLTRGYARINSDPKFALADFAQALQCNPRSVYALQNQANILARLGRNDEALKALDRALELCPDFDLARAGRGVLLARLGKRDAALADAAEVLKGGDGKPVVLFQVAGIYALTSQTHAADHAEALRLLSNALYRGFGFDLIETDKELDPLRTSPEFRRLVDAARALRSGLSVTSSKPRSGPSPSSR